VTAKCFFPLSGGFETQMQPNLPMIGEQSGESEGAHETGIEETHSAEAVARADDGLVGFGLLDETGQGRHGAHLCEQLRYRPASADGLGSPDQPRSLERQASGANQGHLL
jgi:hypothetical protein